MLSVRLSYVLHYQNIMRPAFGEVALDRIMPDSSSSSGSLLCRVGGGLKWLKGLGSIYATIYTRLLVLLFALLVFF